MSVHIKMIIGYCCILKVMLTSSMTLNGVVEAFEVCIVRSVTNTKIDYSEPEVARTTFNSECHGN